jgi:hypothetical protein
MISAKIAIKIMVSTMKSAIIARLFLLNRIAASRHKFAGLRSNGVLVVAVVVVAVIVRS